LKARGIPAGDLDGYKQAVTRVINSLSWKPGLVIPKGIGPGGLLLEINLADLGWKTDLWQEQFKSVCDREAFLQEQSSALESDDLSLSIQQETVAADQASLDRLKAQYASSPSATLRAQIDQQNVRLAADQTELSRLQNDAIDPFEGSLRTCRDHF